MSRGFEVWSFVAHGLHCNRHRSHVHFWGRQAEQGVRVFVLTEEDEDGVAKVGGECRNPGSSVLLLLVLLDSWERVRCKHGKATGWKMSGAEHMRWPQGHGTALALEMCTFASLLSWLHARTAS